MTLGYSDAEKTAAQLKSRIEAFMDGKFGNAALAQVLEAQRAQKAKL